MPKEKYEPPNPRRNHTILPNSINITDPNKKENDEYSLYGVFNNGNNSTVCPNENGNPNLKYGWTELEITGSVKNLSPNLFNLKHLTVLYLNDNNLTALPPQVNELRHLTYLDLSSNKLRCLPPEVGDLITLRELHLNHNYVRTLPLELGRLFQLLVLGLKGNPLAPEILRIYSEHNGTQKLLTHLLDNLMALACSFSNISNKTTNPNILKAGLLAGKESASKKTAKKGTHQTSFSGGEEAPKTTGDLLNIGEALSDTDSAAVTGMTAKTLAAEFRKATLGLTVGGTGSGLPSLIDDPLPPRKYIRVYEYWAPKKQMKALVGSDKKGGGGLANYMSAMLATGRIKMNANGSIQDMDGIEEEDMEKEYSTSIDFYKSGRLNYISNFDLNNQTAVNRIRNGSVTKKPDFFAIATDSSDSDTDEYEVLKAADKIKKKNNLVPKKAESRQIRKSTAFSDDSDDLNPTSPPFTNISQSSTSSTTSKTTTNSSNNSSGSSSTSEYVSDNNENVVDVISKNKNNDDPLAGQEKSTNDEENGKKSLAEIDMKMEGKINENSIDGQTPKTSNNNKKNDKEPKVDAKLKTPTTLNTNAVKKIETVKDDRTTPTSFTLMCYNVLCDKYATRQLYAYCPTWALAWGYRKEKIRAQIAASRADILCLQEVETEQFTGYFEPEMAKIGYSGIFAPKSRAKTMRQEERKYVDGCAIFYKNSRFRLLKSHLVEFNQVAIAKAEGSQNMLNRVMTKDNIGLTALLETLDCCPVNDGTVDNKTYLDKYSEGTNKKTRKTPTSVTNLDSTKTLTPKRNTKSATSKNKNTKLNINNNCNDTNNTSSNKTRRNLLVVSTAHVHWDPEYSDVKIIQAMMIIHELKSFIRQCYEEYVLGFGSPLIPLNTSAPFGSPNTRAGAEAPIGSALHLQNASDLSRSLSLKERMKKGGNKIDTKDKTGLSRKSPSHHENLKNIAESEDNKETEIDNATQIGLLESNLDIDDIDLPCQINKKKRTLSENALAVHAHTSKVQNIDASQPLAPGSDLEESSKAASSTRRLRSLKTPYSHYKRIYERRARRRRAKFSAQNANTTATLTNNRPSSTYSRTPPSQNNFHSTNNSPPPLVDILPLILCGDLNSLPDSGVLEFLLTGKLDADHCEFKDLGYKACLAKLTNDDNVISLLKKGNQTESARFLASKKAYSSTPNTPEKSATMLRTSPNSAIKSKIESTGLADMTEENGHCLYSHTFKLASAYTPTIMPYTNFTYDFCGVLDYILHSKKFLIPIRVLGPLDQGWINRNKIVGAPHPFIPSDHFPILVEYDFKSF